MSTTPQSNTNQAGWYEERKILITFFHISAHQPYAQIEIWLKGQRYLLSRAEVWQVMQKHIHAVAARQLAKSAKGQAKAKTKAKPPTSARSKLSVTNRLLAVLHQMQAGYYTPTEIAARLEMPVRTVQRYYYELLDHVFEEISQRPSPTQGEVSSDQFDTQVDITSER